MCECSNAEVTGLFAFVFILVCVAWLAMGSFSDDREVVCTRCEAITTWGQVTSVDGPELEMYCKDCMAKIEAENITKRLYQNRLVPACLQGLGDLVRRISEFLTVANQ